MDNFKVVFYLFFILAVCLLPVCLFRKNWKETGIVACVLSYFFILNKDFIWGKLGAYHDTRAMYENILVILKQWLDANVPIGWNPYMNAGEPLYLFSNNFLCPVWVAFCRLDRFIQLNNPHILFNLFWLFLFVNFCIGGLLLFYILYDDFKVSLFCFISLVFSSMFIVNLCQPVGLITIYYFPYIFFSVILSFKKKNIYGIAIAVIFLGIAMNHYLPHYLFLCAGVFVFFLAFFKGGISAIGGSASPPLAESVKGVTGGKGGFLILALLFSLLAALPALFLNSELKNYISPARGGEVLSESQMNWAEQSYQIPVKAGLSGYKVLLGKFDNNDIFTHHAFYFGILPLLFILMGFFVCRRNRYFWIIFFTMIVILLLGTGKDFFGFRLLLKYVPVFNVIRHTFVLAHFVSFLLICLVGYGLEETYLLFKRRVVLKKLFYLLVMLLILVDLSLFYNRHCRNNLSTQSPDVPLEITYPQQRTFYPVVIYPKNPDLAPLVLKQAALTDYEGFIFFRNRRLNDMLRLFEAKYASALGIGAPLVYFTNDARILSGDIPKEQFIREVYENSLDRLGNEVLSRVPIEYTNTSAPNRVEFVVDAPREGFLVRRENFHRNWQAFIDNLPVPMYRADYAFQAIKVARGRHKIRFQFFSVYPGLFYTHILVVFLNWLAFNFLIFKTPQLHKMGNLMK